MILSIAGAKVRKLIEKFQNLKIGHEAYANYEIM